MSLLTKAANIFLSLSEQSLNICFCKVELHNFEQFGIFHRQRPSLECHWQKYEKANSQKGTQKQFESKVPGCITTSKLPLIFVFNGKG